MSERATVAVVGAGFSGLLTALHLLSDPKGPQVRLFERRGVFGRGRAYATDNPDHLLNVRVANMSAFPRDPDHFARWLRAAGEAEAGPFVTRGVYGDYLQNLLRQAVDGAYGVDRLLLEGDEVVALDPVGGGWRIETAMGRALTADAVVLALGSLPPAPPAAATPELLASTRYVADPWRIDPAADDLGDHVLLLGSGLTMVDVALSLSRPGRRLTALSRRGLLPQGHGPGPPAAPRLDLEGSPLSVLREVRRRTRDRDWREVIDQVRGSVASLWASWSGAQRRSFLRHLRPWWDVRRHRMAVPVARRIEAMCAAGELTVRAGGLKRLDLEGEGVTAAWRVRGTGEIATLQVDAVVNCTGHSGEIHLAGGRLLDAMLAHGLLRPDPASLGVDVDTQARPLDRGGAPVRGLFAVGPLTRGAFWEITSVPDIRHQAAEVAGEVLRVVGGKVR